MNVALTGHDLDYDSSHYHYRHFTQKTNFLPEMFPKWCDYPGLSWFGIDILAGKIYSTMYM